MKPDHEVDDEMLGRLISLAADAPEPSRDSMERTRQIVRSAWRARVGATRRRRSFRIAAAIAASVALAITAALLLFRAEPDAPAVRAHVEVVHGEVQLTDSEGNVVPATPGRPMLAESVVRTGAEGRIALRLASGHILRIDSQTTLTLRADELDLAEGAVYADSGVVHATGVRIVTPLGAATDIGTSFEVRYGSEQLRVLVRSGTVMVGLQESEHRVESGRGLVVRPRSEPEWLEVASYGDSWEWTRSVAPPFELEGRTVDAFLSWYGRETGRSIRFADTDVADVARTTTLHGTVVDAASEHAAESVLLSAGLEREIREGEIVVRSIHPGKDQTPRE